MQNTCIMYNILQMMQVCSPEVKVSDVQQLIFNRLSAAKSADIQQQPISGYLVILVFIIGDYCSIAVFELEY